MKNIWTIIEQLGNNLHTPWIAMGDFNNVIDIQGRIGGSSAIEAEYRDLTNMMHMIGLLEANTKGSHYTWSNKHNIGLIYSRIDHVLGNADWFQTFPDAFIEILLPHISIHAPIRIRIEKRVPQRKFSFKFLNCITKDPS